MASVDDQAQPQENNVVPPKEMRCVTLTGYGGIRMVKVTKQAEPVPAEGEVAVRVKACGVNFQDLMVRQGALDNPPRTPFTMGSECAGEVQAIGEGVEGIQIGDRVIAVPEFHAWADVVVLPAHHVFKIPTGMTFQDGAALFMNYVTAYLLLFDIGNLRPGQSVLVHSAGGGVGQAVCQLARMIDNVTIFGTASYGKHEALKNQVDHVYDHVVDYGQEIRKVNADGVDLVLDCLCGEDTNKGVSITKSLGKYVLYGTGNVVTGETKSFFSFAKSWWQVDKISPVKLFDENKSVAGFQLRSLLKETSRRDFIRQVVHKLFDLYNKGKIKPTIDSTWALEDVGDAMQKMHDRKNIGKVLIDPSMEPKPKETTKTEETEEMATPPADTGDKKRLISSSGDKKEKSTDCSFIPRLSNNPLSKLKNILTSQDQGSSSGGAKEPPEVQVTNHIEEDGNEHEDLK